MGTDPRVEAAARKHYEREYRPYDPWDGLPPAYQADYRKQMANALAAADTADPLRNPSDTDIDRAAEAAALLDDHDGCFERVREWEALEPWEREAQPGEYPHDDYESVQWWTKRTRAMLDALKGGTP